MISELKVYKNTEFGELGVMVIDGKEYFPATDCAKILGYSNPYDAIAKHCKGDGVVKREGVSITVNQHGVETEQMVEKSYINEGNLYRLIVRSKLPKAVQFERWVFEEVLPSIRKHGAYLTPQKLEEVLSDPDTMIRLLTDLKEERAKRVQAETTIEAQKPKVLFADAVSVAKTSILVGDLAKLIAQNGVDIGQKRLFEWLRSNDYLIKGGTSRNMPTQRSMDMGLFEVKESTITNPDGSTRITRTTKVSGKGQVYFINKLLKGETAVCKN